jgi:hypothetical protein
MLALMAPQHVTAQEIAGIRLLMSDAQARSILGANVTGGPTQPGKSYYLSKNGGDVIVGLCKGSVFTVQEPIGQSLHQFTQEVRNLEGEHGPAKYEVRTVLGSFGQLSSVHAKWPLKAGEWSILAAQGNQDITVSRNLSTRMVGC